MRGDARSLAAAALAAGCAWAAVEFGRRAGDAWASSEPGIGFAISLQAALLVVDFALLALWVGRGLPGRVDASALRWLAAIPLVALVGASLVQGVLAADSVAWIARSLFFTILEAGIAGWLLARRSEAPVGSDRRLWWLEVIAVNALVGLLLLEGGLWIASRLAPSPFFSTRSPEINLAASRPEPHSLHFGSPLQSRGYFDDEFFVAGPDDLVVAVLADSFGLGVVPWKYHFTTRAEVNLEREWGEAYDRVALHNFGVPGIGLPEYALVLEREAMALNPGLVVLCVFVGNDIHEGIRFGDPGTRRRYVLQEWLVGTTAQRVFGWLRTAPTDRDSLAGVGRDAGSLASAAHPAEDFDFEVATVGEQSFLEIETRRIRVLDRSDAGMRKPWEHFFAGLSWFHQRLGDRLLLVVIPDEFQVNDALYETLSAGSAGAIEREAPQRRILDFCAREGIDCLDLLPALRRAEAEGRTYHLRDTHWNARGNAVAADELSAAISAKLNAGSLATRRGGKP